MSDDGSMARLPELIKFAKKHSLKIGTVSDLIKYRLKNSKIIRNETLKEILKVKWVKILNLKFLKIFYQVKNITP